MTIASGQLEMVHVLACFPILIEFIDFESIKQKRFYLINSGLIEVFLFSNYSKYTPEGALPIQVMRLSRRNFRRLKAI